MNQKRVVTEEPQDPFVEKVNRAVDYVKQRSVPIGFAVLVVVAAVIAGVWFVSQRRGATIADYIQIHNAIEGFDKALAATGESRVTDLDKVVSDLSKVTNAASLPRARFFQARASYEKGDYDAAARLYQEVAKPANSVFGLYAQASVGVANEAQKKYAEAAQAYAESALTPFKGVPGYEDALTEAAFGRARAARQLGRPEDARVAYESVVKRYSETRDRAVAKRKDDLVTDAKQFFSQEQANVSNTDLAALLSRLDAHVQDILQKPEAERRRLDDAVRIQQSIEDYLKALADARKAETEGRPDTALYSYESAMGDRATSPTREQYQRAQLELERLSLMGAKSTPSQ